MHYFPLSIPGLIQNARYISSSTQEAQALRTALRGTATRDTERRRLELVQEESLRLLENSGQIKTVNNPLDPRYRYYVQKGTGLRVRSFDGSAIKIPGKRQYPANPFPMQHYIARLETPAMEDAIEYMYLDNRGNPTVGIGHHIINRQDLIKDFNAGNLPFVFRKTPMVSAALSDVLVDYDNIILKGEKKAKKDVKDAQTALQQAIKQGKAGQISQKARILKELQKAPYHLIPATFYEQHTKLILPTPGQHKMAAADVRSRFLRHLKKDPYSPDEFDGFPTVAQMAIIEVAYPLGHSKFQNEYPRFIFASRCRDWLAAKAESGRGGINQDRQDIADAWFDAAALGESFFLKVDRASAGPALSSHWTQVLPFARVKPVKP